MADSPYSQKDLKALRTLLETKLAESKQAVRDTDNELRYDNPGALADESDAAAHNFEMGMDVRLRERQRKFIAKTEQAIARMDAGTYGQCSDCGEWITIERLRARPVAELCIDCKEDQEFLEKIDS